MIFPLDEVDILGYGFPVYINVQCTIVGIRGGFRIELDEVVFRPRQGYILCISIIFPPPPLYRKPFSFQLQQGHSEPFEGGPGAVAPGFFF